VCASSISRPRGHQKPLNEEAGKINAVDREYHGADLFDAIERGAYPKWTMYVQIMTEDQAKNHYENPV
jgi:catalase